MNAAQHQDWILLVDDSSEDRELLQHTLRRNKFRGRVEEARDGIEAIDRLCCRGTWPGKTRTTCRARSFST